MPASIVHQADRANLKPGSLAPLPPRMEASAMSRRHSSTNSWANSKVSAVVAQDGSPHRLQSCLDSARRGGLTDLVIASPAEVGVSPYDHITPDSGVDCFANAMNKAVSDTTGEIVLLVPALAQIRPGLIDRYAAVFEANEQVGVVYGNYEIAVEGKPKTIQNVSADPFDLSEWSTFGYVRAIRRSVWNEVGGYDSSYRLADDYDLRLRLGARCQFVRIHEPLYDVVLPADSAARRAVCASVSRYFTPETSAVSGYGYLFLESDLRTEVERAFLAALQRHGAFLGHRNQPFACPHHGAEPIVSVIIPTHDRKPLLRRAIESAMEGTFRDFEIIVVDNGSADGTAEMVERMAHLDSRIRLIRNRGRNQISAALNLGVQAARGKYISQLDSDDEYTADTLFQQIAHLEAEPAWGLAISYYEVIDEEGRILPEIGVIRHAEYDRNNILRTSGAGAVRTWHRCVIENLGGFDERTFGSYAEDYDLILKASERYDIGRVHATLYRCRRHQTNNEQRLDAQFRAERKAEARRRAILRRQTLNLRVEATVRATD
ncbi:MAG TPA: glycosyltransferase [Candidatus Binataceae bacterium]|nr:glycosyltransferase [Candidatus Binataceae bacterium]